jgi:hypothetical protein
MLKITEEEISNIKKILNISKEIIISKKENLGNPEIFQNEIKKEKENFYKTGKRKN